MSAEPALAPCPFCGGGAQVKDYPHDAICWCTTCGAQLQRNHGPHHESGYPGVIAAWNRRVGAPS